MKTAIIIGATGLVGAELLNQLLDNEMYAKVKVLHRRSTGKTHPKLEEHIIDFDDLERSAHHFQGDVLFSALGTTLRAAGSQEAQFVVDHTYQFKAAKLAIQNGVSEYVLVSSAGADPSSRTFYTRMKGELEREILTLNFNKTRLIRPSFLDGDRQERRLGERIGIWLAKRLAWVPGIKNFRPVPVTIVAQAMQKSLLTGEPIRVIELLDVFLEAER